MTSAANVATVRMVPALRIRLVARLRRRRRALRPLFLAKFIKRQHPPGLRPRPLARVRHPLVRPVVPSVESGVCQPPGLRAGRAVLRTGENGMEREMSYEDRR